MTTLTILPAPVALPSAYSRTWSDQPAEVEHYPVLLSVCQSGKVIEIRCMESHGIAYLTVGGLFGSETLRCISLPTALRAAHIAIHTNPKKRPVVMPSGCALVTP